MNVGKFKRSFFSDEYIESIREQVVVTTSELHYLASLFERVPHFDLDPGLKKNLIQILKDIIENLGSAEANIKSFHYPQNMKEAWILQLKMKGYEKVITCLKEAAFQRFEGYSTEQSNFFFAVESEYRSKRVYRAIDTIVCHFLGCFFPREDLKQLITLTYFGDKPTYGIEVYGNLAVVQLPRIDSSRCRFWACLGHESVHERFAHTNLTGEYKELQNEMIEDISSIGQRLFQTAAPSVAAAQFEEIICDLSSLIISGLPDLMTLVSFSAIPRLEADNFSKHPPLDVRINYMYRYLSTLKSDKSDDYNQSLEICRSSWNSIKEDLRISYRLTNREKVYIQEYNQLIDTYFEDLVDLARHMILVPDDQRFSPSSWERANEGYQKLIQGRPLVSLKLNFTELFNLAWIKRLRAFKSLISNEESCETFLSWHSYERKLFEEFVNTLIEM